MHPDDLHQLIIESTSQGVWFIDPEGHTVFSNRALCDMLGYTAEEMQGRPIFDFMSAERRSYAQSNLERRGDGLADEHDFVLQHRDGHDVRTHMSTAPLNRDGVMIGAVAFITNLRDLEQAQTVARESLHTFERLAHSICDGLWRVQVDASGAETPVYVSPGFERIWGSSAQGLMADPALILSVIFAEDRPKFEEARQSALRGQSATVVYRITQADETVRWIEDTMSLDMTMADGTKFVDGVARDITERLAWERRLQDAQRHESLALMAAGVAHDFNNLLVSMLGQASYIRTGLPMPEPELAEELSHIEEAAKKAATLCQQLQAYAGADQLKRRSLDLSGLVEASHSLLLATVGHQVQVELQTQRGLPAVFADPNQLRQLLLNIVSNAAEAVDAAHDGRLIIRTGLKVLDEGGETLEMAGEIEPGPTVYVEVEDNGVGMSPETRAHLFDPFYTTHFMGRGLGMASVLGIARSHKGAVAVRSELGKGTCVSVYLPAVDASTQDLEQAAHKRRVLLVDDDAMVARVATNLLRALGFEVTAASSGREALELWRRSPADFDALLIDLVMPGMRGTETLAAMAAEGKAPPTLFMSGYSVEDVGGLPEGLCLQSDFLAKPFSLARSAQAEA